MKRKNPSEPNGWTFIVGGGRTIKDGKAYWPDCITVFMPRRRAYDILHSLAVQLGEQELDEISLSWCGSIENDAAEEVNYYKKLDALRCKHGFAYTHNPGGGEFYRGDLRCQIKNQDYKEDYDRFVEWLRENGLE